MDEEIEAPVDELEAEQIEDEADQGDAKISQVGVVGGRGTTCD